MLLGIEENVSHIKMSTRPKNLFENSKFLSESYHFTGKYSQNRLIVPIEWQKMTVSRTLKTDSKPQRGDM